MIKIAIIGLGHIGRILIQALQESSCLELVSACDKQSELASLLPVKTAFYVSHQELLQNGGFDTVVVATPNSSHCAIALDALRAGYNVVVEKPAAESMVDLELLENTAQKHGSHVYYAFHAACAPEVIWLKEHLKKNSQKYGPMTSFFSCFYDPYIDASEQLKPHAVDLGDCWIDSGVNALSVLNVVLPVDCLNICSRRQSGRSTMSPGIRSVSVYFNFATQKRDNSGMGVVETAWDQDMNYKCTDICFGCTGWKLTVNHSEQSVIAYSPDKNETTMVKYSGERLLNHYQGVFQDYISTYQRGVMNGKSSMEIHRKFFEAVMS